MDSAKHDDDPKPVPDDEDTTKTCDEDIITTTTERLELSPSATEKETATNY
jgi:hypothetical protein